ncbi:MAG: tRNA epoxyqueuosine(34) reductase QueG, partial [Betaproteobacteria bacterium]|nr:tRNA epoxyqueuosine(34) reductase QueG [Betaproteobacteria bacterium]
MEQVSLKKSAADLAALAREIKRWGAELGFQQVGIADCDLSEAEARLLDWLGRGYHGEMEYMERHGVKRARPAELVPGTVRVIAARMNCNPPARAAEEVMADGTNAFIARYTLGRDYHKIMRGRLQKLAERITSETGEFHYRVFTDSAPVMEVEIAQKAGLGWRGKHTLLLNREAGSFFALGEIYTDLPLPTDQVPENHCGTCQKCMDICPTGAIVGPYQLDARRCIAYLTVELKGSIPEELRPLIGNRVFGCDDCQDVCPWNRKAPITEEPDVLPREGTEYPALLDLIGLSPDAFRG